MSGDPEALRRIQKYHPSVAKVTLADAQFVIAREHGFESWPKITKEIATRTGGDAIAAVWKSAAAAVAAGDAPRLERLLHEHEQRFRTQEPQSIWSGGLTPD